MRSRLTPYRQILQAVRVLSGCPAVLDLFMWLSYRCFSGREEERISLSGGLGLAAQLGNAEYARPRKFREKLGGWLEIIQAMWPECPARLSSDGRCLILKPAAALTERSAWWLRIPLRLLRKRALAFAWLKSMHSFRHVSGPTRGLGNSQPACFNRQVAMYLAAQVGRWNTTAIGRFYDGRDHSTVCHGIQQIGSLKGTDPMSMLSSQISSTS